MIHHRDVDDVAIVTIDRPERRNALDHAALAGLRAAVDDAVGAQVRALVLTGSSGHFCAGADLAGVDSTEFVSALTEVLVGLREAPFVTIAAVEGFALGAGTQLAIACDLRVAAPDARFGVPAAKLGLMVDWWTVERAASLCGQGAARAMFLTAEQLEGERAHALGLVQRLGDLDTALGWAAEIAALAPLTVRGLKLGLNLAEPVGSPTPEAYAAAFRAAWSSDDLQEGLAAFGERRPPRFGGR